MSLSNLKNTVDGFIVNNVLTLTASANGLASPMLDQLLDTYFNGSISGQVVSVAGDTATIDGEQLIYQLRLNATNFSLYRRNLALEARLIFVIENDVVQLTVATLMPVDYQLADSIDALGNQPTSPLNQIAITDSQIHLSSKAIDAPKFEAKLQPAGPLQSVAWMIPDPLDLSGIFGFEVVDGNRIPIINATALITDPVSFGIFSLDLAVRIRSAIYLAPGSATSPLLLLQSGVELITDLITPILTIPVVMPLYGEGQHLVSFYLDLAKPAPTINSLNDLSGFTDSNDPKDLLNVELDLGKAKLSLTRVSAVLNPKTRQLVNIQIGVNLELDWQIIPNQLELENIGVVFTIGNPSQPKIENVSTYLFAQLKVGSTQLQTTVLLPNLSLRAKLAPGNQININDVIATFAEGVSLPSNDQIIIYQLDVFAQVKKGQEAFSVEAGALGTINIVEGLRLTEIYFFILYQQQALSEVTLSSTLNLPEAQVDIFLIATYQNENGWQFEGSTGPNQTIHIGALIQDVTTIFNTENRLPDALSELIIENLHISFNTKTKNFHFTCQSQFPIGTHPDDKVAITVTIDIINDNGSYTKSFGGHIEASVEGLATPLIFDLRFVQNNTSTILIAAYSHTGGAQSLNLVNLIKSVVHTDSELINLIPAALTIDLKDALFVYIKDTPATDTTPAQGRFLFGLDIGANLDLSKLPLVGKEFPPNQTIGVDNLQLLVASKAFTVAEVGTINMLLLPGVTPLPDVSKNTNAAQPANTQTPPDMKANALEQGLNMAAKLNLSITTQQSFTLPVAAGSGSAGQSGPPITSPPQPGVAVSDSAKWFTIQKSIGPVHFNRIGFQYKDQAVYFLLDAALAAVGLTLSLDGLGFGSPLDHFEPIFELHGLGIDYKNGPLEIGGAFLRVTRPDGAPNGGDEYDGMAIIKTEQLTLAAIGSYTRLNGQPSLFIYAVLDYPIGGPAFFFITGLAAGFGYNRNLLVPGIDQLQSFPLIQEAINNTGDMRNLAGELSKLSAFIPPAAGTYFLAVGIKFTSFKIIDSFALVSVIFGERFELDILGLSTLIAPTPETGQVIDPLAEVQMALKATFIPAEGFLGVQAQLTSNSYLFSRNCHLTGGFAFFVWFKGDHEGDFVQTIGGYHPSYKRPDHYPAVPRLGFNWQVDSNLLIKGDAYYALTPSALMAGGHLEATWQKGSLEAYFTAGADFLISWKPYYYDIRLYVYMAVKYTYHFFGTHQISVDIGADLHIWGPDFSGEANIHLWIVSFSVTFGAAVSQRPKPISWNQFHQSFLPKDKALDAAYQGNETICTLALKDGLLKTPDDGSKVDWVVNPKAFTLVTNSVIPAKHHDVGQGHLSDTTYNADFGIGPMDNQIGDIKQSSHKVTIISITERTTQEGKSETVRTDATAQFEFSPVRKNVPIGMWGQALTPQLNGPKLVENTLAGFEIRPRNSVLSPPPEATQDVERAQFKYTIEPIERAYTWQSYQAFDPASVQGKAVINQTLTQTSAARQAIVAALELTTAEIMLNDKTADAFIVAPQVGT